MKKLIFASLFVLVTITSSSQELKFSEDTLYLSQVTNKEYYKTYKDNYEFKFIKMQDGSVLSVGEEIKFGRPVGNNTISQTNSGLAGTNYSRTGAFSNILYGRLGLSVMNGMQYLPDSWKGRNAKIIEIKRGRIILDCDQGPTATVLNVSEAFSQGELINPKGAMTRSEAIAKLKEQKDLLDLGMISKDDYEKSKSQLSPIISGSK
jgi:hypothetical protein